MVELEDSDKLTFNFFCNLKSGDEICFYNSDYIIKISQYKKLNSFIIEYISNSTKDYKKNHKIRVVFAYGSWYTGLKSKSRSKSEIIFNTIWRNVEGEIIMNLLNTNNPFHQKTEIFKIATNKN